MFDFATVFTSFGGFLWVMFFFILALSVVVAVHEYGHYIVGRWCGIHAEVFSVGFGSVLISRVDQYGTRWQIAALPFGGYVKFKADSNAASAPDGMVLNSLIRPSCAVRCTGHQFGHERPRPRLGLRLISFYQ